MDLERINKTIITLGLKKNKIARKLNIDPSTLSRFLNGHTMLNGEALIELCRILKLDPESLEKKAS